MAQKTDYIAVFDSGVGGISVLRELKRLCPNEHYLYFGDSANAPYGTRTTQEVKLLTLNAAAMLYERGIKCLVVACNTATAAAIAATIAIAINTFFMITNNLIWLIQYTFEGAKV